MKKHPSTITNLFLYPTAPVHQFPKIHTPIDAFIPRTYTGLISDPKRPIFRELVALYRQYMERLGGAAYTFKASEQNMLRSTTKIICGWILANMFADLSRTKGIIVGDTVLEFDLNAVKVRAKLQFSNTWLVKAMNSDTGCMTVEERLRKKSRMVRQADGAKPRRPDEPQTQVLKPSWWFTALLVDRFYPNNAELMIRREQITIDVRTPNQKHDAAMKYQRERRKADR